MALCLGSAPASNGNIGKTAVETSVKVETADQKFNATSVRYANTEGKYSIQEIRLGGTRTRLVLNP